MMQSLEHSIEGSTKLGQVHLQDAQVILGKIETNIPQYAIEY